MAMKYSAIAMRVLAPCVLIVAIMGVFRGFFQGNGSMIPTAFSQVLEQVVNAVASIAGAYFLLKLGKILPRSVGFTHIAMLMLLPAEPSEPLWVQRLHWHFWC